MKITSHIKNAFEWWLQGLLYFCPHSFKRSIGLYPDQITVELKDDSVIFKRFSVDSNEPIEIQRFMIADDVQRLSVLTWLHEYQKKHVKISLLLSDTSFLKKNISFPSAVKPDLREALGYELDRRTPFSQDQAYYDYRIVEHDEKINKLYVDILVVPKQIIESDLMVLNEWDIRIDALKSSSSSQNGIEIELLTDQQNGNTVKRGGHTIMFLAASTIILFLAVLYLPLIQQTQQIKNLEDELKSKRQVAMGLQKSKEERNQIINQINFLENKKSNAISSIEIIDELTRIIPDDSSLTRLVIKKDKLQIQGESSNASSLIQIIESSERYLNAKFRSPVTKNNVTGKDKFHVTAQIVSYSVPREEI